MGTALRPARSCLAAVSLAATAKMGARGHYLATARAVEPVPASAPLFLRLASTAAFAEEQRAPTGLVPPWSGGMPIGWRASS